MSFTPPSSADRGFSLIEILVAMTLMLTVTGLAGAFFITGRNTMLEQISRVETVQGLRFAMYSMVRDLRLGGACLPITGDFVTLDGTNSTTDQIVTRTGQVRSDETCVRTVLTNDIAPGDAVLPVHSASGFVGGMRAYVTNGATGELFDLTGTDARNNRLQTAATLTRAYANGSGVYAVDERAYAVDASHSQLPVLTLAVNGGAPAPFAYGIENLQIQYELARNCDGPTGCDVVDVPATDAEFALVNQVFITITARSQRLGLEGQYYRISRTVSAKPRNLLHG